MSHATTASLEPSLRHLEGFATPWLTEKMLDGQHQRVDIPAHARTAHKGLLQKRLKEDLCWIFPIVSPTTRSVKWLNWPERSSHASWFNRISFCSVIVRHTDWIAWLIFILAVYVHNLSMPPLCGNPIYAEINMFKLVRSCCICKCLDVNCGV